MARQKAGMNSGRIRSSNITVTISIALVLFLLGLFGLIVINAQSYADFIKEQLQIEAFFKDSEKEKEQEKAEKSQLAFIDSLKTYDFIKSVKYISKEEASKIAKNQIGIDDHALFEEEIFPASAQISLKSAYVTPEKLDSIVSVIENNPLVEEAMNDQELALEVFQKIRRISFWLITLATLFLLIVIVLINNSIRLKIYEKRFSIKTMQLVGARRRFIMKPFIIQGILLGLFGALLAILVLGGAWYVFTQNIEYPFWNFSYVYLIGGLIFIGIFIAFLSTTFATWRYLKLRTNQLY